MVKRNAPHIKRAYILSWNEDKYKMTDFEKLTDFENLYKSYCVSLRHCRSKRNADLFRATALEQLLIMKKALIDRTYELDPYNEFVVTEPKRRMIMAGSFKDKVLQHCLCDCVLLPRMQRVFIRNNYAGQTGKGTLFGLNCLSEQLEEFYSESGHSGYILKCDISKFYYSISHDSVARP